ncbi:MAG: hypothetical protein DI537_37390 [Stutzerimonas stutzeri]|nr:MAG: hypothetical protein DI537_37390 [Stutzerimonas stutzeri]
MDEKSKQRLDADRAFHRLQSQEKTNDHALSASDIANQARDANTARLRDLRLQKEAQMREAAIPSSSKARKDRTPD